MAQFSRTYANKLKMIKEITVRADEVREGDKLVLDGRKYLIIRIEPQAHVDWFSETGCVAIVDWVSRSGRTTGMTLWKEYRYTVERNISEMTKDDAPHHDNETAVCLWCDRSDGTHTVLCERATLAERRLAEIETLTTGDRAKRA